MLIPRGCPAPFIFRFCISFQCCSGFWKLLFLSLKPVLICYLSYCRQWLARGPETMVPSVHFWPGPLLFLSCLFPYRRSEFVHWVYMVSSLMRFYHSISPVSRPGCDESRRYDWLITCFSSSHCFCYRSSISYIYRALTRWCTAARQSTAWCTLWNIGDN